MHGISQVQLLYHKQPRFALFFCLLHTAGEDCMLLLVCIIVLLMSIIMHVSYQLLYLVSPWYLTVLSFSSSYLPISHPFYLSPVVLVTFLYFFKYMNWIVPQNIRIIPLPHSYISNTHILDLGSERIWSVQMQAKARKFWEPKHLQHQERGLWQTFNS